MKNDRILMSATRMSTFLQCKYKYWCQYVKRLPRKPNPAFKLGIACHSALELAGNIWRNKEKFTRHDIQKIRNEYRKVAAEEGVENMVIYEDGLNMVLSRLDSFSVGKIIEIEKKFNVSTPDGVMLIGAMDRVSELNEETILVTDYKTSKYFYTDAELKEDIQLSVYDLVASLVYPDYKRIVLSLDYLRGDPVYTYRTYRERASFAKYLLFVYEEMLKLKEKDAKPMINDMCNWCDHNDVCPAYKEVLNGTQVFSKDLNKMSDDELVAEYTSIKSKKRIVDEHEKKLKSFIMKRIETNKEDVVGNNTLLYVRQNKRTSYNPHTLYKAMPLDTFLDSISIENRAVEEFMIINPAEKEKILASATTSFTTPFIAQRKIKSNN